MGDPLAHLLGNKAFPQGPSVGIPQAPISAELVRWQFACGVVRASANEVRVAFQVPGEPVQVYPLSITGAKEMAARLMRCAEKTPDVELDTPGRPV